MAKEVRMIGSWFRLGSITTIYLDREGNAYRSTSIHTTQLTPEEFEREIKLLNCTSESKTGST